MALPGGSEGKPSSDEAVAKEGTKEWEEDEEGEGRGEGEGRQGGGKGEHKHLAALDLHCGEDEEEGDVDEEVGDGDDGQPGHNRHQEGPPRVPHVLDARRNPLGLEIKDLQN